MDIEDLRLAVYRAFAETGRAPGAGELAEELGAEAPVVAEGLEELAMFRAMDAALAREVGDHGQRQ